MMKFDRSRVQANAQKASTEELMDRLTIEREGMEPEAEGIIRKELSRRGIGQLQLDAHETQRRESVLWNPDGTPVRCSRCTRPAVSRQRGWHRLWGWIPLFPRWFAYCAEHGSTATRE